MVSAVELESICAWWWSALAGSRATCEDSPPPGPTPMRIPNARLAAAPVIACLCAAPALAQQAHVNLDWAPHRNTGGLVPFGANVLSPEVDDQRRVTFR